MNLDSHIRDIWIAIGVLSGLGIIFAMIETSVWQTQAGKQIIDLGVCEYFCLLSTHSSPIHPNRPSANYYSISSMPSERFSSLSWQVFLSGG